MPKYHFRATLATKSVKTKVTAGSKEEARKKLAKLGFEDVQFLTRKGKTGEETWRYGIIKTLFGEQKAQDIDAQGKTRDGDTTVQLLGKAVHEFGKIALYLAAMALIFACTFYGFQKFVELQESARIRKENAASTSATPLMDWRKSAWTTFVDPDGRFRCEVPPGWTVDSTNDGKRSRATLSFGPHEIRITVRSTNQHVMYDGVEDEMVTEMGNLAQQMGRGGKVEEVQWTTLAGSRALRIDLGSRSPFRFARTIKAKHGGYDHFLGLYLDSVDQKPELTDLFAKFLDSYDRSPSEQP